MGSNTKNEQKRTAIGGQAVMEGIMMRGKKSMAIAVRDADGMIRIETKRLKENKSVWAKIPVIRGVFNFVSTMIMGVNTLMRSADVYGEAEPTKFEDWLSKKLKINLMTVVTIVSLILGLGLAVALFVLLPTFFSDLIYKIFWLSKEAYAIGYSFLVGGFKILILIGYLFAVSLIKDIKRTFMYHGAEHETINCYESGKELSVENVQSCTTLHNRCGTTFLFHVLFISIIVFIVLQQLFTFSIIDNFFIQTGIRILSIPLVAGLAYEFFKFLAKHDWAILKPLKLPGLGLQKITTKKPTDDMVEVAIKAFKTVMAMDEDDTIPEVQFVIMQKTEKVYEEVKDILAKAGIDGDADRDWIFVHVLGVARNKITEAKMISAKNYESIIELAKKRASGMPLQYVLGETEFYGCKIKVNQSVLIPRFETELVAEKAVSLIDNGSAVLDLCTGSGCIAVAVKKKIDCKVTASDISADALSVAKENALENGVEIEFIKSDMFEGLSGRFDCIISNPPYIETETVKTLDSIVKEYEPITALDGGADGLAFYRIIADKSKDYLTDNGKIVLEIGEGQAKAVTELFSDYADVKVFKDLCGKDRIFTAARRSGINDK